MKQQNLWQRFMNMQRLTVTGVVALFCLLLAPFSQAQSPPSDTQITLAVLRALDIEDSVPANSVDVFVEKGVVRLTGTVPHLRAKERMVELVETVRGVRTVINQVHVLPIKRPDESIEEDVQAVLSADPAVNEQAIDVTVKDGVVHLNGTVTSWAGRNLAAWVASGVAGIIRVQNDLLVNEQPTRTDQEIMEQIKRLWEADVWVNEDSLILSVKNGVVHLDGVVGSLAEKRRVRRDVQMVGVSEIDDSLLFVKSWANPKMQRTKPVSNKTDEEIRNSIQLGFVYDPRVLFFNPDVHVENGVVTLTGTVGNLKAKQAAEHVAWNTRGVLWVKNFLKVRPKNQIRDDLLQEKVAKALQSEPYLTPYEFDLTVNRGMVTIKGHVDKDFEKELAGDVAARVQGVVEVTNYLKVDQEWTWKPDRIIKQDIEDELWWSPFVESENIEVKVKNGFATLTGEVDTYPEYRAALENAKEGGAKDVISQLTIRSYDQLEVLPEEPLASPCEKIDGPCVPEISERHEG